MKKETLNKLEQKNVERRHDEPKRNSLPSATGSDQAFLLVSREQSKNLPVDKRDRDFIASYVGEERAEEVNSVQDFLSVFLWISAQRQSHRIVMGPSDESLAGALSASNNWPLDY